MKCLQDGGYRLGSRQVLGVNQIQAVAAGVDTECSVAEGQATLK